MSGRVDRPVVMGLPLLHDEGRAMLSRGHRLIELDDPREIERRIDEADALYAYPPLHVSAGMIARAPRLKLIAAAGSGVDHIAVRAAQAAGIVVTHAVGAGARSVAEHAIGMMLALAKQLVTGDADVREGRFERRHIARYDEISGGTLVIVGYGAIGRELARIAHRGFGMDVIAVTRDGADARDAEVLRTLPLEQALPLADIVSIHVPLADDTRGLIGDAEFARMKPGAWLVDTSRGGVVDAAALHRALVDGGLGGAALDVFDPEPPPADAPLFALANVVLSPHCAGITRAAYRRLAITAAEDIARVLRGERPRGLVGNDRHWAASRARTGIPSSDAMPAKSERSER